MKIRSFTISLLVLILFSMNMISCGATPVPPTQTSIPTVTATSTPAVPTKIPTETPPQLPNEVKDKFDKAGIDLNQMQNAVYDKDGLHITLESGEVVNFTNEEMKKIVFIGQGNVLQLKDENGNTWGWDGKELTMIVTFSEEQLNQMTNEEKMETAPKFEDHEKWRAAGQYIIYTNKDGEVDKAYDFTTGEYRDIPDYPVTTPENFRDSEIPVEDLFNGNYFLWLEKQAKTLSCNPDMRTDIPMIIGLGRNLIIPEPTDGGNFVNGGEFFVRDHTAAFTKFILPDGQEVHYAVMPLFMCDLEDRTNLYPIITVNSSYNPNSNRSQDEDNVLYMNDAIPRWRKDMNITAFFAGPLMTAPNRKVVDPLVALSHGGNTSIEQRIENFLAGDFSTLSEPGIVMLSYIATAKDDYK